MTWFIDLSSAGTNVDQKPTAMISGPTDPRAAGLKIGDIFHVDGQPEDVRWKVEKIFKEEWRILPSNSTYEVSNLGRVRSRDHQVWGGRRMGFYTKPGRLLRPGIASTGYPTVALGRGNTRTVHSLVAEAFFGPCPIGKEIRHKDGVRTNPRWDNLEYGTRLENIEDAFRHGTRRASSKPRGRKMPCAM